MRERTEPVKIGMVGTLEVVSFGETPCLVVLGPTGRKGYLSVGKCKSVLANDVAVKEFIAKFDVAKAPKATGKAAKAVAVKQQMDDGALKLMAQMQAQIAALTAAMTSGNGRQQPSVVAKAA